MNRKKILFFQHVSSIGGSSWCLLEIIQELDRSRYEPIVVLRTAGPLADALSKLSVQVCFQSNMGIIHQEYCTKYPYFQLRYFSDLKQLPDAVRMTRSTCETHRPDLVYLNSAVLFPLAIGAKRAGVKKVLLHIREHWFRDFTPFRGMLKNFVSRNYIDRFVSISKTGATRFGFPERTDIARDWVDFSTRSEDGSEDALKAQGIDVDQPFFLAPGGDSPVKGTIDAIKAFRHVKDQKAQLVVLGIRYRAVSGVKVFILRFLSLLGYVPAWYTIQHLAKYDSRVVLIPHIQGIQPFIEKCVAVVGPFRMPHCAKAALEAGMLGRPSILSEGGEAREYVVHEETGLIVPVRKPKALAAAMNLLLNDPDLADRLGAAARIHVEENFSAKDSMEMLRCVFNTLT